MNKSRGFGRSTKCHEKWPNTYFAEKGLFTRSKEKTEAEEKGRGMFDLLTPMSERTGMIERAGLT
jgi:hypothetical protein